MFSPDELGELQEARAVANESDLTMPMMTDSPTALPQSSSLEDPSLENIDREVAPCPRKHAHDWSSCPYLHEGETKARRRCPRKYAYTSIACPSMKQVGMCPQGDACPFAHNDFEYWLHHTRYHTCLCNKGQRCDRKFCFFAHSRDELRTPAERPRLPPGSAAAAAALRQSQGGGAAAAGARGASRGTARQGSAGKLCSRAAWRLSLGGSNGAFGGGSFSGSGYGGGGFATGSPSGCLGGSFGSGLSSASGLSSSSGLSSGSGASGFLDGSSFGSASGNLGYALEQLQVSAAAAAAAAAASGSFGGSSELRVGSLGEAASGFSAFAPQGSAQAMSIVDPQGSSGWGAPPELPLPGGEACLLQPQTPPSQPGGVEFLGAASFGMPVSPFELAQPVPAAPPAVASGQEGGTSRALMAAIAGQLAHGQMDAATATTLLAQLLPPQALVQLSTELELQATPAPSNAATAAAVAGAGAPMAAPAGMAAPPVWLASVMNGPLGHCGQAAPPQQALRQLR
ncbi:hypothetical protein N2152v2_000904 [Parachlorella kessleri]